MNPGEDSSKFEIVSAREFSAPRERVFELFSNPDHLMHWWGPNGFTNAFSEFDLRPGGRWRFVMHGPDGAEYPMEKEFVEVVSPERVVLDHLGPMHRFRMTMTFADLAGRTGLIWRMLFEDAEEAACIEGFLHAANEENFDRLEDYLAKLA
ncbi:MAG TPA: SRPBCC family protein [Thermoanaerobaculia bacterium]|nr:SRPBCC family protein [Thermoanaerobaculia bacterium]